MKEISSAIVFGFKEVFHWHSMKYILLSGIAVVLLWLGIGFAVWDSLVALSSHFVEMLPFSMVRSNGAWMLSAFLWFQLTLVTFALIFAFGGNLLLRKFSKEQYATLSIYLLLGAALSWGVVWFFEGEYIYDQFLHLMTWLPFETVEKGIASLMALYLLYNGMIVSNLIVASFLSEPVIEEIELCTFSEDDVVRDNLFKSFGYALKDSVVFILLSLIAFPLLFVPVLNLFVQIALWVWLTQDTISYSAYALSHQKFERSEVKKERRTLWVIGAVTVLFNFVPVLNLFGPYFGVIAMFHYFKEQKRTK